MRKMLFLAIFALAAPVRADWAEVPLEVLVDEADLIVMGKVTKVQDGGFAIGNRKYDVAVMEPSGILKSSTGKPKFIHVAQPGMGIVTSADIRFRAGQQGIWLLTKDPERNVYWARHPGQRQEEKEQKKLMALIDARAKVTGGKEVNGLVARAELLESPFNFKVRFSLKNVSEKPVVVCDYVGDRSLQTRWLGPDGKPLKSRHYDWLALAFIGPLAKSDFATIQPGGVRFISHGQGIVFQPAVEKQSGSVNVVTTGQHKITVSFVEKADGKPFGLENVWTGTVTGNELTISVK